MKKIITIVFSYLRGEAHYQFLNLYNLLLIEFPAIKNLVSVFYDEFAGLLAQEKQIVDAQKSSDYTQQIADADHRDDRLITGIRETVSAALHHFDPAVVTAAQSLWLRLKTFGEIQAKSYEEEAAAINILTDDLRSAEYASKVELLGLTPWVNELVEAVAGFEELLNLRNIENAAKPKQRLRDTRKQIETVYRNMINHINAAAILDTTDTYTEFINRLNTQITYFNDHNHHTAPKNIRTANVDVIVVQQFSGKAITPIPTVHLDGVELVFAKDFNLTYKNNIQPGVAEMNIVGKGNYAGKKNVTFNIE
jgi:3-methyladenine DNA glycosylase AlkD